MFSTMLDEIRIGEAAVNIFFAQKNWLKKYLCPLVFFSLPAYEFAFR